MRQLIRALPVALLTLLPLAALAENESDSMGQFGDLQVVSLNPSAFTATLSDGTTYRVAYAADFHALAAGEHISARWVTLNGYPTLTFVTRLR